MLSPEVMGQLPPNVREQITASLADSIANTFMWALVPAVLALVFVLMMGNERVTVPAKAPPKPREPDGMSMKLAILGLLLEGDHHPYEIRIKMKDRGMDQYTKLQMGPLLRGRPARRGRIHRGRGDHPKRQPSG